MIYDRPYMQSDFDRRQMSALIWILGGLIVAFVAQSIVLSPWIKGEEFLARYVVLSLPQVKLGFIWQFLTYGWIHTEGLHLLLNLVSIYFFGKILLPIMGGRRFVGLFFGSLALGALATTGVAAVVGLSGNAVGASAFVSALITVMALAAPNTPVGFLLLPFTIRPKHLAVAMFAIDALCLLFFEFARVPTGFPPSHLLGGMLAGWLYFKFIHSRPIDLGYAKPAVELPAWLRKRKSAPVPTNYKVNVARPQDIRAEVDRILDKINSQGFGALTDEERRVLDDARDILNKH